MVNKCFGKASTIAAASYQMLNLQNSIKYFQNSVKARHMVLYPYGDYPKQSFVMGVLIVHHIKSNFKDFRNMDTTFRFKDTSAGHQTWRFAV